MDKFRLAKFLEREVPWIAEKPPSIKTVIADSNIDSDLDFDDENYLEDAQEPNIFYDWFSAREGARRWMQVHQYKLADNGNGNSRLRKTRRRYGIRI